jgi:CBS domain-containing protein
MKVGDVMTRRVRSCRPTHSAETVMHTLWEQDLGALPVVNEIGEPIAMITDRDIAVAAYTQGKALHDIPVHSAMSKDVRTAHISDSLLAAERTMRIHQLHRLPVIDESNRLVGVLSLKDLVVSRTASGLGTPGEETSILQTLAAIARPRSSRDEKPADSQSTVVKTQAERTITTDTATRQISAQVRELDGKSPKASRAARKR